MCDLADADDSDSAHSMQVFWSQILNSDHIKDSNDMWVTYIIL